MTDLPFLVAGGGIAGLGAALGLARTGRPVHLFEQASAFEEVGAGLQMSPNGVRALKALGAWERVEPRCVIPSEIHIRDGLSGAMLQRVRLGAPFEQAHGAPYRVCHRVDLLAALVAAAQDLPAIRLETGIRAAAGDGTGLVLPGGRIEPGAAIIAADGIRSALRESVCAGFGPIHRGATIFRALIPFDAIPPGTTPDAVTLWLCPGAHVVHYPVSGWQQFNIVAAVDGAEALADWSTAADRDALVARFSETCAALGDLIAAPARWLKWPGADLAPLPRWRAGRTVLVGDAAHATLPFLAQGAVMALEDGCILAAQIAAAPLAEALAAYEQARKPRTTAIQQQSRRNGRIYHASGLHALARNMALRLAGAAILDRQTRWIYGWSMPQAGHREVTGQGV